MATRKSVVCVCLFAFSALMVARPCAAQDDPFTKGLTWALTKSVGKLTEVGYKTNCKARNLDYKSDASWYCGLFASLSGQDKAEFEERLAHNLAQIRADLTQIQHAIAAIQDNQDRLYQLNEQILLRLDEIGPETNIGKALSHIRTDWDEQYVPMFTGERSFNAERLLAFARQIIFEDKIHKQLGAINDQLAASQLGRAPLLRAYAKRLSKRMEAQRDKRLDPAYHYLEAVVDGLLAEQRKGYVMYMWAAQTLQTACDVTGRCDDATKLPHQAQEYRAVFARHLTAQLAELNAGLEWQILAWSDPHRRQPNFLHPEAERLFARADLFTAAHLEAGFGIRGRVISMGEAFDGRLTVSGVAYTPSGPVNLVPTEPGRIDWWTTNAVAHPPAYDELHFSDRWKIYHYHLPRLGNGSYVIDTPLPYKPPSVKVAGIDLDGTVVPFGSFTAIARAGGGYALLSGEWGPKQARSLDTVIGAHHNLGDDLLFDSGGPHAGVKFVGRIEWKFGALGKDQHIEAAREMYAVSKKKIRYAGGGPLSLHVDFADTYPLLCPTGGCVDYNHHTVLSRLALYKKGPIDARAAEITVRTVVLLDTHESGKNGIVWEKAHPTESSIEERILATKETARITLAPDTRYPVIIGGAVKLNMQTSGYDDSTWVLAALAKIENAYVEELGHVARSGKTKGPVAPSLPAARRR